MHKAIDSNGVDSFVKTQSGIQAINGVMEAKCIKRVIDILGNSLPVLAGIEAVYAIGLDGFGHGCCSNLDIAACGQYL